MDRVVYDWVVVVSNDLSYDRRMIRCCNTLAVAGNKVLLVGRELPTSVPLQSESFDQHRVQCSAIDGPRFYVSLLMQLKKYLQTIKYSNLLLVDLDTALLSRMLSKNRKRYVLDLHEYFEHVPELTGKPIKKSIWYLVGKLVMPKMEACYTVNQSLADIFSKTYHRKVNVVRNVPSLQDFGNISTPTVPIQTTYLGVLNPGRGLKELIRGIRGRRNINLRIIGDGPLRVGLENEAQGAENISFLGVVVPERIHEQLEDVHFGWNLLEPSSKSYYYSLANKFFDYVHHGVPVLTMGFPEYQRLVQKYNCGLLIKELEQSAVETFIDQLEANFPSNWNDLKAGCHQCASENHWQLESEKLLEILSSRTS